MSLVRDMKIELEKEDIESIARGVLELIKPALMKMKTREADDTIFDVKGLADYLKVDESWIYKQVSQKTIPYFKAGKYTRFKKAEIDNWVEGKTLKPIPPLRIAANDKR